MIVVAAVTAAVAVLLLVLLLRERARTSELLDELAGMTAARGVASAAAAEAEERARLADQARDDALERVQRSRRDAAEVAARLTEETAARAEAEAAVERSAGERARVEAELATRTAELEAVRAELASRPVGAGDQGAEVLWDLALGRIERLWRTSIALLPEDPSPLEGSEDPLRSATEVVVDAAREEAGADIELVWTGSGREVPIDRATVALAVVESVVETVAKSTLRTTLRVGVAAGEVEIAVESEGDVPLDDACGVPTALSTGVGRYRVA
jgi:hypothetical protein